MPQAKIVQTAQRRPGGDFLTGDSRGPFLDTGVDLGHGKGRYGNRIYLSLKHLAPILREEGWLTVEDVEDAVEELGQLRVEVERLREIKLSYDALVGELARHVEPRVVERPLTKEVTRPPTEEELTAHVLQHRRDLLKIQDLGSDARYAAVYKGHGYLGGEKVGKPPRDASKVVEGTTEDQVPDVRAPSAEDEDTDTPGISSATFELQGQQVSLDEVLAGNVKEVINYAAGHPDEFKEALVMREYELGDLKGKPYPRKGVIEGLGYEFEDDGEES